MKFLLSLTTIGDFSYQISELYEKLFVNKQENIFLNKNSLIYEIFFQTLLICNVFQNFSMASFILGRVLLCNEKQNLDWIWFCFIFKYFIWVL